jgi:hypothetical protein
MKVSAAAVGALTVGVGTAIALGNARWTDATAQLTNRLAAAGDQTEPVVLRMVDLKGLPAPVARYFRATLKDGQRMIRAARIVQTGAFRVGESASQWRPLRAIQYFSVRPAGLVWDADIQMAPLMRVRVRDSYVAGTGAMRARLLAVVPVVDAPQAPELNAGALQRYLAEAAWFPTALLPSQGVAWSAIDDARALATLTDAGITVALEFRFNAAGQIVGVYAPGRGRFVDGRYEPTPWAGRFRSYEDRNGMQIPIDAEVEWRPRAGTLEYARIHLTDVHYDF